jgi:hypothetical protein
LLCRNSKHYTTWKNIPDKDKAVLLTHMDEKKKMWLNPKRLQGTKSQSHLNFLTF